MRAVADAHPSLSRYLTTQSTGAVAEAPFSERLLLSEIAAAYEEAVFDAGEVERLKSIRDDARQSQILIQFRYRGGEASIYDVTSGQDAAIAADLAFVSGSVRAMRSRDEVDRLGRGD
jgi:hypothetical protein